MDSILTLGVSAALKARAIDFSTGSPCVSHVISMLGECVMMTSALRWYRDWTLRRSLSFELRVSVIALSWQA